MLVLLNPAVTNTKMKNWTSLFAQKLRSHRIGSGRHGRMTQEELAMILNVSVDAISKYERSLSYIRGDLEYQLQVSLQSLRLFRNPLLCRWVRQPVLRTVEMDRVQA